MRSQCLAPGGASDAGAFVVASAGNDGPECSTISHPLSLYDEVFSVGVVDSGGALAEFSSRGPVISEGSGQVKPGISAPGVDVYSSLLGGVLAMRLIRARL